eukprot:m.18508 g.18508  ORF g.18508 m.18508 type:complete len:442 (+) comp27672_c0_seq1:75-1400(+)
MNHVLACFVTILLLPRGSLSLSGYEQSDCFSENCRMYLVESMPDNLTYVPGSPEHTSTYNGWKLLIDSAEETIDIGSFYWTLRGTRTNHDSSDWEGKSVFDSLLSAGNSKINIRIVQTVPSEEYPNDDTAFLAAAGAAEVRSLNLAHLIGGGILHAKFWIVDSKHFYIGSANLDWRSLTQVKELGVIALNCSCLANQLTKAFSMYWAMALPDAKIPSKWSSSYATKFNLGSPLLLNINGTSSQATFGISPPAFLADGWSSDLDVILHIIASAEEQINVAVMDYFPTTLYAVANKYWPVIDDALRSAAFDRGIHVRLLASWWNHTLPQMKNYLRSLASLNGTVHDGRLLLIEVSLFTVPAYTEDQKKIPYARVNHNKYMVTDNAAYVGTSNWSGDYFIDTAGVGLLVNQTGSLNPSGEPLLQEQLLSVFNRDWNSNFTTFIL